MEVFMKRILLVIILGLVLAGCNFFSGGKDDYTELFDNIEDAGELRDSFYEAVDEKIDDDGQSLTFAADLFMVSTADLSASLYLAVVELYLVTPKLSTVDIEKKGDTYTFSDEDENEQVKVKFDQKTNSYSLEVSKDGTVTLVSEMTKLGKNHFAYQIYTDSNEKMRLSDAPHGRGRQAQRGRRSNKDTVHDLQSQIRSEILCNFRNQGIHP